MLAGNHDASALVRATFADRLKHDVPFTAFDEQVQGVRLLGLDTSRRFRVSGKLGAVQFSWLSDVLTPEIPPLIFMHHPPVSVGTWWLDKDLLRDRRKFAKLVNQANVLAVVSGHVPQSFEGKLGNVTVWATPSTAYQFSPGSWLPRVSSTAAGFRVIECSSVGVRSFTLTSRSYER